MDAVLAPWLTIVDHASCDNWRQPLLGEQHIHATFAVNLNVIQDPSPPRQRHLREAAELITLAAAIDADALASCVARNERQVAIGRLDEAVDTLKLRLLFGTNTSWTKLYYREFLNGWSEENSSTEYQQAKTALTELQQPASRPMNGDLMNAINLDHFHVSVETFYAQGADVRIKLKLPDNRNEYRTLTQWKVLLNYVTRRNKTRPTDAASAATSKWDINVVGSKIEEDPLYDVSDMIAGLLAGSEQSDPDIVKACLSALAHADESVSSIRVRRVLEDGRNVRASLAKVLAYMVVASSAQTLRVVDTLSDDDMDAMETIFSSQSRYAQLVQLWKRRSINCIDGLDDVESFLEEDPTKLLAVENEVFSAEGASDGFPVDPESDGEPNIKDQAEEEAIWLADYGQYTTEVPFVGQTISPVYRVVDLIGAPLEELSVKVASAWFPVSFLARVLRACPRLRRLSVSTVKADENSDGHLVADEVCVDRQHPLDALTLRLESVDVVSDVVSLLVGHGIVLKELSLSFVRRPKDTSVARTPNEALGNLFANCVGSLTTLKLYNESFGEICTRPLLRQCGGLTSLALVRSGFGSSRSRGVDGGSELQQRSFDTLASIIDDQGLKYVQVSIPCGEATALEQSRMALEINPKDIHRCASPFSIECIVAFLACLDRNSVMWEAQSISRVFAFAAQAEKRRVAIASDS